MSFAVLTLLVVVGLSGPLLASAPKLGTPLVVGEILAGVVVGKSGFNLIPVDDPSLGLLSSIGFALLMLIVGTHLPLNQPELKPAFGKGVLLAIATAVLGLIGAVFLTNAVGLTNPGVLAILLTTSSAAVALPVLQAIPESSDKKKVSALLVTTAWISIVDVGTVLSIPLVIREGSVISVIVGILIIAVLATGVYFVTKLFGENPNIQNIRKRSKAEHWALDLRLSLVVLFAFAAIATYQHASILIAGFAAGAVLALNKRPHRLAQQLIGLGEGFLVPLFFVTLGANIKVSDLIRSPQNLTLTLVLVIGATLCHVLVALAFRLPLASGLLATAQLGVPAAVASLGLASGLLTSGQAAAVLAAVLITLIVCTIGAKLFDRTAIVGSHVANRGKSKRKVSETK